MKFERRVGRRRFYVDVGFSIASHRTGQLVLWGARRNDYHPGSITDLARRYASRYHLSFRRLIEQGIIHSDHVHIGAGAVDVRVKAGSLLP